MCRIKFQGESLGTFLVYEVVMGAINAHSRVAGSPEAAQSVSVNLYGNFFAIFDYNFR